jgi:hypothetical protein
MKDKAKQQNHIKNQEEGALGHRDEIVPSAITPQ